MKLGGVGRAETSSMAGEQIFAAGSVCAVMLRNMPGKQQITQINAKLLRIECFPRIVGNVCTTVKRSWRSVYTFRPR